MLRFQVPSQAGRYFGEGYFGLERGAKFKEQPRGRTRGLRRNAFAEGKQFHMQHVDTHDQSNEPTPAYYFETTGGSRRVEIIVVRASLPPRAE